MNEYEEAARERKAIALVALFVAKDVQADVLVNLPDAGWEAAARLVEINQPSLATRVRAIELLREHESIKANAAKIKDPFAKFDR